MGRGEKEGDEAVSPAGRFFLLPKMDQVINCIIGFENEIDIEALKAEFRRTLLRFHPRLSCLVVRDANGLEHWRPTPHVNIDDHITVVSTDVSVNDYVADLTISSPLSTSKPLWEIHILSLHRCAVIRLHHSLGDGIALMSLLLTSFERADGSSLPLTLPSGRRESLSFMGFLWKAIKMAILTFVFVVDFLLHAAWKKDEKSPITGGAGVEMWPRKLCTVSFDLGDVKVVKSRTNTTVNDVLVGIISSGLKKYFNRKPFNDSRNDLRITGLSMVNIRKTPGVKDFLLTIKQGTSEWGNQIGYVLLPISIRSDNNDPFEYVRQAKRIFDLKKQSLEAHFSYRAGVLVLAIFGLKVAASINYRIICNTSFTLSNVVGPNKKMMFARNPISYIRGTSSSLPHALTIHMISYNGKIDMQLLVAKDIIHEPETLAKCMEDAFMEMKLAAITKT